MRKLPSLVLVCLTMTAAGCASTGAVPRPFPGAQPGAAPPVAADPTADYSWARPAPVASRVTAGRSRCAARGAALGHAGIAGAGHGAGLAWRSVSERRQRPLGVRLQWPGAVRVRAAGHRAATGRAAAIPGRLRNRYRRIAARGPACSSTPNRTGRHTSRLRSTARPSSMRRTHGGSSEWSGCRRPTGRSGSSAHAASNR